MNAITFGFIGVPVSTELPGVTEELVSVATLAPGSGNARLGRRRVDRAPRPAVSLPPRPLPLGRWGEGMGSGEAGQRTSFGNGGIFKDVQSAKAQ